MTASATSASGVTAGATPPHGPGRSAVVALVLIGMCAVATQPALALYHGSLAGPVICAAAALAIVTSFALRRAPAWIVAPVSLALLGGCTLAVVTLSGRIAHVPGSASHLTADALRGGVARMLGTLLPLEAQPDTLVAPMIAVWIAGLAAAEAALRHRRVVAAYMAPLALYIVTWVFAGPHTGGAWWRPVAFVSLAVIGSADRLRLRSLTAGAAVAALAIAVTPLITATVAAAPADFHHVTPPRDDTLDENPMIRLSGWNLNAKSVLFTATISGAPVGTPVRLRLAVLPDYDGVTWRVDSDYRPAGTILAPGRGRLAAHLTMDGLDGHLLPAPDNPKTISGVRAAVDPSTGTLMRPDGLAPGLSYTVSASPGSVDADAASASDVPSGPTVAEYLALPGTPPDTMLRLAQQIGADSSSAYDRADGVAEFLRDHYRLVSDAPSGHAYPNLNFFLFGPRNAGGQRGTSEQFAAAFAVLGRMLGLPTRVVVGFDATAPSSTVRGADAVAWPEVLFDAVGWVPFDPLPTTEEPLRNVEDDFAPKVTPPSSAPTDVPTAPDSPSAPVPTVSSPVRAVDAPTHVNWALISIVTVLVVAAALAVAAWQRRRERLRWTEGSPVDRVTHAWWAIHRSLRKAGHGAPAHLDASAVAVHAARFAEPPLDELVAAVNSMTFGGAGLSDVEVEAAQAQARAYLSGLKPPTKPRHRFGATGDG